MNCREIYNAFKYDFPKVEYRTKYMMPKVVKELQKECKFPAWRICKYTVPESCNTYNLCYYAEFPENAQSPTNIHYCIVDTDEVVAIIRALTGKYLKPDGEITELKQIHLYTYHFLEQYNKRFLKNDALSHEEIACMFSCRNKVITPIRMNERINRNYKKHGRFNSHVYEVRDGVCFAQTSFEYAKDEEGNLIPDDVGTLLILFTTFMNENDMSEEQLKGMEDEQKILFKTIDKLFLRNLVE
jgi:hypothetical protein